MTGVQGFLGARLAARSRSSGTRHRAGLSARAVAPDATSSSRTSGQGCRRASCEGRLVAHLARSSASSRVLRRPRECWSVSVDRTSLVSALARARGARLVFTSSSEVYGEGSGRTLGEDDALPDGYGPWPRAAYAEGKRLAEDVALAAGHRVARLFNASGPGQRAEGGMVVPTFVRACLHGLPLPIVGDGNDTRCFQHRDDAVAGLLRLLRAPDAPALVNIGGRELRTVRGLALEVRRLLRSDSPLVGVTSEQRYGAPCGGCRHRVPDLGRMERELGHRARLPLSRIVLDLAGELREQARPAV
ncbi:MAG: NAD-dependent epimerase/dehydratase family protein [Planctomycetota bacterium]